MALDQAPVLAITGVVTIAIGFVVLLMGYFAAIRKDYRLHYYMMIGAVTLNALFLIQYIIRYMLGQETHFEGPVFVRNFIYYPILTIHISLSIVVIFLIVKHLRMSLNEVNWNQGMPYFRSPYNKQHRGFGRKLFFMWFGAYLGGIVIFFMLYVIPF